MKVHHLNCGTMDPPATAQMVCHVLLVETDNGLVLVDTGFGSHDCAEPKRRLGPARYLIRPALHRGETAVAQVERLGYRPDDVRHIVITHFDADHIGGLADFPEAQVHVTATEAVAAMQRQSWDEKMRFRPVQWAHGPNIVKHKPDGDSWRGFAAAKELTEISEGIVLISMPGHTRGHACVAVDAGHRWVLHAGDAFFHQGTLDGESRVPRIVTTWESLVAFDRKRVRENHSRLTELYGRGESDLLIVCAHDPTLFERALATA